MLRLFSSYWLAGTSADSSLSGAVRAVPNMCELSATRDGIGAAPEPGVSVKEAAPV